VKFLYKTQINDQQLNTTLQYGCSNCVVRLLLQYSSRNLEKLIMFNVKFFLEKRIAFLKSDSTLFW